MWESEGKTYDLSASEYITKLSDWVLKQLDDPAIFPTDGSAYPKNFEQVISKIWKRLARIYFHIYYHHWDWIQKVEAEAHVNTCFKHFYYFSQEFHLVKPEEFAPVENVVKKLIT